MKLLGLKQFNDSKSSKTNQRFCFHHCLFVLEIGIRFDTLTISDLKHRFIIMEENRMVIFETGFYRFHWSFVVFYPLSIIYKDLTNIYFVFFVFL